MEMQQIARGEGIRAISPDISRLESIAQEDVSRHIPSDINALLDVLDNLVYKLRCEPKSGSKNGEKTIYAEGKDFPGKIEIGIVRENGDETVYEGLFPVDGRMREIKARYDGNGHTAAAEKSRFNDSSALNGTDERIRKDFEKHIGAHFENIDVKKERMATFYMGEVDVFGVL